MIDRRTLLAIFRRSSCACCGACASSAGDAASTIANDRNGRKEPGGDQCITSLPSRRRPRRFFPVFGIIAVGDLASPSSLGATTSPAFPVASAGTAATVPPAYMDPREDLVGILMTQRLWDSASPPPAVVDFWTQAYSAIQD